MTNSISQDLTAEEKSRPYSKYFYRDLAEPDPELMKIANGPPMDPSDALPIDRINDLLDPGYHKVETGYCIMPDGSGYACVNTKMPGVTFEMLNWWMSWFPLESLRYKMWYKKEHVAHYVAPESYGQAASTKLSGIEKFHGATHIAIEDIGAGKTAELHITFMTPKEAGFDVARFTGVNKGIIATNTRVMDKVGGTTPMARVTMIHFIREILGGIELRTRFWMGYSIVDKKPVCMLPAGVQIPLQLPRGAVEHSVCEFSNLRSFLPELYAEESNR